MRAKGRGKNIKVEWTTSDRQLMASDVERLEDLIAHLIARQILDERSADAHGAESREDRLEPSVGK